MSIGSVRAADAKMKGEKNIDIISKNSYLCKYTKKNTSPNFESSICYQNIINMSSFMEFVNQKE